MASSTQRTILLTLVVISCALSGCTVAQTSTTVVDTTTVVDDATTTVVDDATTTIVAADTTTAAVDGGTTTAAVDGGTTTAAVDGGTTTAAVDGGTTTAAVDGGTTTAAVDGGTTTTAPPADEPPIRSTGNSFAFSMPHLQSGGSRAVSTALVFINDAAFETEITIKDERRPGQDIIVQLGPDESRRVELPYEDAQDCGKNTIQLLPDSISVESVSSGPTPEDDGIAIIFEQYFDSGGGQGKATLILPSPALGTEYTVPGGAAGSGPFLISAIAPDVVAEDDDKGTNVRIEVTSETASPPSHIFDFKRMPRDRAMQFELDDFDGASISSEIVMGVTYPLAVQAMDSNERLTMLQSDATLGSEYALGPGSYLVYATAAGDTQLLVNGRLTTILQKGEHHELLHSDEGRTVTSPDGPLSVFYLTANDWTTVPAVTQFVRERDIQFVALRGQRGANVRVVADDRLIGALVINNVLIEPSAWRSIGEIALDGEPENVHYSYADLTTDREFNRINARRLEFAYIAIISGPSYVYVPAFDIKSGTG